MGRPRCCDTPKQDGSWNVEIAGSNPAASDIDMFTFWTTKCRMGSDVLGSRISQQSGLCIQGFISFQRIVPPQPEAWSNGKTPQQWDTFGSGLPTCAGPLPHLVMYKQGTYVKTEVLLASTSRVGFGVVRNAGSDPAASSHLNSFLVQVQACIGLYHRTSVIKCVHEGS